MASGDLVEHVTRFGLIFSPFERLLRDSSKQVSTLVQFRDFGCKLSRLTQIFTRDQRLRVEIVIPVEQWIADARFGNLVDYAKHFIDRYVLRRSRYSEC